MLLKKRALLLAGVGLGLGLTPMAATAAAAATPPVPASPSSPYLKNFRTTHLSGRFVTPDGKAIAGAIVYLAIDDPTHVTTAVTQIPVLAQTKTDPHGHFAFSVPKTSAVLQAAKANHGNLNLIVRAMELPSAPAFTTSSGGQASTQSSTGTAAEPAATCASPAPAITPVCLPTDAVDHQLSEEKAYGPVGYAKSTTLNAGTLALGLIDPYSMYPREVVSTVERTENLTLTATKGLALITADRQNCVKTVSTSCPYDPVTAVSAYPQDAIDKPALLNPANTQVVNTLETAHNAGNLSLDASCPCNEPDYCQYENTNKTGDANYLVPVADMHAYWDVAIQASYSQDTTSSIGAAVHYDSDPNSSWQIEGSFHSSSSSGGQTNPYSAPFAERFGAVHHFLELQHDDQCYDNNTGETTDYYWSEIDDKGWTGAVNPDGSDLSWEDGPDAYNQYQNYTAPEDADGNGFHWWKSQGQGYHYGAEAQAFGVGIGAQTDWNQQVREDWYFGRQPAAHYLFGHDGFPPDATNVFSY